MAYVTLLVIMATSVAGLLLCRHLVRLLIDARTARITYRATVEGLAERTHHAAKAERERALECSEVAEATQMLAHHATEMRETLALERKLRKAIASTPPPLAPHPASPQPKTPAGREASA
jgi:biopolymer transport protein ExbB/TolQ